MAIVASLPYVTVALLEFPGRDVVAWVLIALPVATLLPWALPRRGPRYDHAESKGRIDERTVMFARGTLEPGTERFDAHFRVVCPLVARDAGLGEIGRMGLLMTPELGPRVCIGVVTTDAPLVASPPSCTRGRMRAMRPWPSSRRARTSCRRSWPRRIHAGRLS